MMVIYFSIGDRFNRDENPQNIDIDGGKIYRIHDDGKIPNDNPFVENLNSKKLFSHMDIEILGNGEAS